MKKTFLLLFAFFVSVTFGQIKKGNTKEIDDYVISQTIQKFQIGYLDKKNGYIAITKTQLSNFFLRNGIYSKDAILDKYFVVEGISASTKKKKYILRVYATDGERKIKIRQDLDDNGTGNYIIAGESCSCSSTCQNGCEANTFIGCSCTNCGDVNPPSCTKTHTKTDKALLIKKTIETSVRKD